MEDKENNQTAVNSTETGSASYHTYNKPGEIRSNKLSLPESPVAEDMRFSSTSGSLDDKSTTLPLAPRSKDSIKPKRLKNKYPDNVF